MYQQNLVCLQSCVFSHTIEIKGCVEYIFPYNFLTIMLLWIIQGEEEKKKKLKSIRI